MQTPYFPHDPRLANYRLPQVRVKAEPQGNSSPKRKSSDFNSIIAPQQTSVVPYGNDQYYPARTTDYSPVKRIKSADSPTSDNSGHEYSPEFRQVRRWKGVRQRRWGKWVTEIREPKTKSRVWLGSYDSPEEAATVYDMAARMLNGSAAKLNFPNGNPRPVTVPRAIAEALLRAAQRKEIAPAAPAIGLPPQQQQQPIINSHMVQLEAMGCGVLVAECPEPAAVTALETITHASGKQMVVLGTATDSPAMSPTTPIVPPAAITVVPPAAPAGAQPLSLPGNYPRSLSDSTSSTQNSPAGSLRWGNAAPVTQVPSLQLPPPALAAAPAPAPAAQASGTAVTAPPTTDILFDLFNLSDEDLFGAPSAAPAPPPIAPTNNNVTVMSVTECVRSNGSDAMPALLPSGSTCGAAWANVAPADLAADGSLIFTNMPPPTMFYNSGSTVFSPIPQADSLLLW